MSGDLWRAFTISDSFVLPLSPLSKGSTLIFIWWNPLSSRSFVSTASSMYRRLSLRSTCSSRAFRSVVLPVPVSPTTVRFPPASSQPTRTAAASSERTPRFTRRGRGRVVMFRRRTSRAFLLADAGSRSRETLRVAPPISRSFFIEGVLKSRVYPLKVSTCVSRASLSLCVSTMPDSHLPETVWSR